MSKKFWIDENGQKHYITGEVQTEGKTIDEEVEETTEKLSKSFGSKIDAMINEKLAPSIDKLNKVLAAEKLFAKDPSEMTKSERIVNFFKACVNKDVARVKALSEGTAADGGYLFPDEFRAEVIQKITADAVALRNLVRVIPMSKDVMKIPALTARPLTYWTAEGATKTTTSAEFNEVTLTAHKLAAIIYATDELIADSTEISVVDLIIEKFADDIKLKENQAIAAGTGTGQPTGLTQASLTSKVCSGNLDFDDIIDTFYLLSPQYRANASWLINPVNIKELRKAKDSNGRYLWEESAQLGQPATILGLPVYECPWIPESEIYFGDWKRAYYLGDRQQMTVKVTNDSETAFTKDMTGIRVVHRIAGITVLTAAAVKLTTIP